MNTQIETIEEIIEALKNAKSMSDVNNVVKQLEAVKDNDVLYEDKYLKLALDYDELHEEYCCLFETSHFDEY